jgi:hypothetical protein
MKQVLKSSLRGLNFTLTLTPFQSRNTKQVEFELSCGLD